MTIQRERYPLRDDVDAAARFNEYTSRDPFPDIPAALLNSADIYDYVRTTGMIYPFDSTKLKSASYEASVGKDCIYWDDQGKRRTIDLSKDKEGSFVLNPNSIAFVTTRERFRLPDYMAVRFNLTITNVHRGLLLGTGPLIDPGFEGYILIPLHNLTTNTYKFVYEEKLIWLEFTKISPKQHRDIKNGSNGSPVGQYVPFPQSKKEKRLDKYLKEPEVRSSIPDAIYKAGVRAEQAEVSAKRSSRHVTWAGIASIMVIILSMGAIYLNIRDITGKVREKQGATTERVTGLQATINELKTRIAALEEKLDKSVSPERDDLKQAEKETSKKAE